MPKAFALTAASAWHRAELIVDESKLLEDISSAAREAGAAILKASRHGFDVETKTDRSPVTEADRAAEQVILAALSRAASGVPVIAEEEAAAGRIPAHGDTYFLVDPLDGTKEFIKGGDDYTVNIGLIKNGSPQLGVVFAPACQSLYAGIVDQGAWVEDSAGRRTILTRQPAKNLTVVASKSHFNQSTAEYLEKAAPGCGYLAIGSSLKFCVVAKGQADIYPRLSPTSEWDTAAGHAVLLAAGGRVDGPDGMPLKYGKRAFLNRAFVATGGWQAPILSPWLKDFSGGGDLPEGV